MRPLSIGIDKAREKIKHYCGYQERTHQEVRDKLYGFGIRSAEVEQLISEMIQDDYLNEERFAIAFAGGKFRMKQWGRVKIKMELQQKRISTYCVKLGLKEINETDYAATLKKLAEKKLATIKGEKNIFITMTKLRNYLLQKGYESPLVTEIVNELTQKKK
jgi:regulatory protein